LNSGDEVAPGGRASRPRHSRPLCWLPPAYQCSRQGGPRIASDVTTGVTAQPTEAAHPGRSPRWL